MFRYLLAAAVAVIVTSVAAAQTSAPVVTYPSTRYPSTIITEYPTKTVVSSGPVVATPAVGLGAVSSPFYFGAELSIGGPGYAYRGYPPYNGWSSGYRGAHYGSPVPNAPIGWRWRR